MAGDWIRTVDDTVLTGSRDKIYAQFMELIAGKLEVAFGLQMPASAGSPPPLPGFAADGSLDDGARTDTPSGFSALIGTFTENNPAFSALRDPQLKAAFVDALKQEDMTARHLEALINGGPRASKRVVPPTSTAALASRLRSPRITLHRLAHSL